MTFLTILLSLAATTIDANVLDLTRRSARELNLSAFDPFTRGSAKFSVPRVAEIPETFDSGFWFANFTVGASRSLELLVDTGSTDVILDYGKYRASPFSKNLHQTYSAPFGTTNSNGSGSETATGPLYDDLVGTAGLNVYNQELGVISDPDASIQFPHDGLIGFAGPYLSAFNGTPWFQNLCDQQKVPECRFGLAFNTDGTGTQILGFLDQSRFPGSLTVAPLIDEWVLYGDVALNGKVIEPNRNLFTDSGTTTIQGPIDDVQMYFDEAGIQSVLYPGDPAFLYGYYPCDAPPQFGLKFPAQADIATANKTSAVSKKATLFNVARSAFQFADNGNNNCTAVLMGSSQYPDWTVGQAFFQTHYIDHDVTSQTMGFAKLY